MLHFVKGQMVGHTGEEGGEGGVLSTASAKKTFVGPADWFRAS